MPRLRNKYLQNLIYKQISKGRKQVILRRKNKTDPHPSQKTKINNQHHALARKSFLCETENTSATNKKIGIKITRNLAQHGITALQYLRNPMEPPDVSGVNDDGDKAADYVGDGGKSKYQTVDQSFVRSEILQKIEKQENSVCMCLCVHACAQAHS